ncbi:MAG: ABC transporter substrate-binding protein [Chloroflexi bacterium]|nr:ABC transporter substrate-binding protein [Chloroflexota bacterium]
MEICSLLPSGTEILYALGLGDQIVGVTDLCEYPAEVSEKPIVCRSRIDVDNLSSQEVEAMMRRILEAGESPYELDGEWISSNSPDVVLTQDLCYFCEVDAKTVGRTVEQMPMPPEVVVLNPRTLKEIFDSIVQIGEICGARQQAIDLVADLEGRVKRLEATLAIAEEKPRVFSLEGVNPLVIGGHWIPDMLLRAGGDLDMFQPGCPATRLSWEQVVNYAPQKLFVDLCSSGLGRQKAEIPWLAGQENWVTLPAVQSGEVYLIDHVYFSVPGPRIVTGLEILAQLTHPSLFDGLIPSDTVLKLDASAARSASADEVAECFVPWPN